MPGSARHRSGSALVIAVMLVVILGGLAISLTETSVSGLQGEHRRSNDLALAMAAESAANIALDHLQRHSTLLRTELTPAQKAATLPSRADLDAGRNNCDISADMDVTRVHGMPVGARWCYVGQRAVIKKYVDGLPRLEVVAVGTPQSMTQDVYYIRAWATSGSQDEVDTWRTRRVELLFVPYPQEVFVRAMFAHNGFDFQGDARTDSWDGAVGVYSQTTAGSKGDLASEGDISVQKLANVHGKVEDFISYPLPPVEFDATLPHESPAILASSVSLTAGRYRFEAVNLQEPAQLTVQGEVTVYVDGPVGISGGKKFNPIVYGDSAARLTIIQDNYDPAAHPEWKSLPNSIETINGNAAVGHPGDPGRFLYISAFAGETTFNGTGVFGGVLYLPNATLKLNGTFDLYGSIIADTFASKDLTGTVEQGRVNGAFFMHYDERLSRLRLPLPPRLAVVGWFTTNPVVGGP